MKELQVTSLDAAEVSFEDFFLCVFDRTYCISEGCNWHFAIVASSTSIVYQPSGRNFKRKVLKFVFPNNLRSGSSEGNDNHNCSRQAVC